MKNDDTHTDDVDPPIDGVLYDCPDCGRGAPQEWRQGTLYCAICNKVILE